MKGLENSIKPVKMPCGENEGLSTPAQSIQSVYNSKQEGIIWISLHSHSPTFSRAPSLPVLEHEWQPGLVCRAHISDFHFESEELWLWLWRVCLADSIVETTLFLTRAEGHDEVEDCPSQNHNIVNVHPARHYSRSVSNTCWWKSYLHTQPRIPNFLSKHLRISILWTYL